MKPLSTICHQHPIEELVDQVKAGEALLPVRREAE